ncbi:O-antigen polymerase [Vibrio hibernica]|uniref:O-antigen polymerase n=1 Tax=Vibrio hibernica TaxID=2587465 RepID=UPI00187EEF03|nr:O-antigen polymerase [Vibrio hibernica]
MKLTLYGMMILSSSYILVEWVSHFRPNEVKIIIIESILLVSVFYALISILVFTSPTFNDLFYSLYDSTFLNDEFIDRRIRTSGIFYGGFSIVSVYFSVVYYIALSYGFTYKKDNLYFKVIPLIFIFVIIFTGRVGLLIVMLISIVSIFSPRKYMMVSKRLLMLYIFIIFSLLLIFLYFYYDQFSKLIMWSFELFINLFSGRGITSSSTSNLFDDMMFLPDNLFLGEGFFYLGKGIDGVSSDSGYIMLLYYGGVISMLTYISIYLYIGSIFAFGKDLVLKRMGLLITLLCLILNIKDIYLFGISGITQIYFILLFLSLKNTAGLKHE